MLTAIQSSKSATSSFLRDAKRFALRFGPILKDAPLQIYSSALLFAPQASVIRQIFVGQIPEGIEMLSRREGNWDACRSTLEGHSDFFSAVAFSPDGRYLKMNRGFIPLPSHLSDTFSLQFSPQINKCPLVFVEDRWVKFNKNAVLWLPPEYLPSCTAVYGEIICIGHESGKITILQLYLSKMVCN